MIATAYDPARNPAAPAALAKQTHLDLTPSTFRDWVSSEPGARFQPEPGRYHLYVMYGCPWAHRALIVRALKGLEHAVDMTAVHYHLNEGEGWIFAPEEPEPLYGLQRLRQLYVMAEAAYSGRITVPVLWDKRERTIVNNESSEIIRMFNSAFNAYATRPELDLYPGPLRAAIDRWNERIYSAINVGAYCGGFAVTQAVYDQAVHTFFAALDELEVYLGAHRYLVGDQPTEADWRLFPTLIRFEWVYHGLFKCNLRRLVDYPHLFAYTRELYQWPGIAATINERHTRDGYYGSMRKLNPSGIVPAGPLVDFRAPHGRGPKAQHNHRDRRLTRL
jgi:glutathionyl-hydroquinone reductase